MPPPLFQNPGYAPGHIEAKWKHTSNVSDRRSVLLTPWPYMVMIFGVLCYLSDFIKINNARYVSDLFITKSERCTLDEYLKALNTRCHWSNMSGLLRSKRRFRSAQTQRYGKRSKQKTQEQEENEEENVATSSMIM